MHRLCSQKVFWTRGTQSFNPSGELATNQVLSDGDPNTPEAGKTMGLTGRLLWSLWSGKEVVERTECSKAPALGREAIKEGTAQAG